MKARLSGALRVERRIDLPNPSAKEILNQVNPVRSNTNKCRSLLGALLLLLLGTWSQHAFASDSLEYESTSCSPSDSSDPKVRADIEAIRDVFETAGLGGSNPDFGSGQDFHGVDEIFTPPDLGPMAFLKLCLKPKNPALLKSTIKTEDGVLFHGQTPAGMNYAIFFTEFDSQEIQDLTTALKKVAAAPSRPGVLDYLIPSAHAGRELPAIKNRRNKNQRNLASEKVQTKGSPRDILGAVASCGVGLGKGVLAATVAPVVGIVRSTIRFIEGVAFAVRKPAEAWGRIVNRVKQLGSVIKGFNLSKALKGAKGNFDRLPFTTKVQVICTVVGAIGTAGALTLLVAPLVPANLLTLWNILSAAGLIDQVKDYMIPPEFNPNQPVTNSLNRLIKSVESIGTVGTPAHQCQD